MAGTQEEPFQALNSSAENAEREQAHIDDKEGYIQFFVRPASDAMKDLTCDEKATNVFKETGVDGTSACA